MFLNKVLVTHKLFYTAVALLVHLKKKEYYYLLGYLRRIEGISSVQILEWVIRSAGLIHICKLFDSFRKIFWQLVLEKSIHFFYKQEIHFTWINLMILWRIKGYCFKIKTYNYKWNRMYTEYGAIFPLVSYAERNSLFIITNTIKVTRVVSKSFAGIGSVLNNTQRGEVKVNLCVSLCNTNPLCFIVLLALYTINTFFTVVKKVLKICIIS